MLSRAYPPCPAQPDPRLLARTWPCDATLKRRSGIRLALTFSPPRTD